MRGKVDKVTNWYGCPICGTEFDVSWIKEDLEAQTRQVVRCWECGNVIVVEVPDLPSAYGPIVLEEDEVKGE